MGPSVLGLALEPRRAPRGSTGAGSPPTPTLTREPDAPGLPPSGSHQRQDCQRPWAAVLFPQKKKEKKMVRHFPGRAAGGATHPHFLESGAETGRLW